LMTTFSRRPCASGTCAAYSWAPLLCLGPASESEIAGDSRSR
jgi:hypothetical protein